jgi:hypothetical protein
MNRESYANVKIEGTRSLGGPFAFAGHRRSWTARRACFTKGKFATSTEGR